MIVVIQCAGSKRKDAGTLQTKDGTPVKFVAQPCFAPQADRIIYARPDDLSNEGESWRDKLLQYNEDHKETGKNLLKLLPACDLYKPKLYPDIYHQLVKSIGSERLYILSAGWGLIRADFLTPAYDITFSKDVKCKAPLKYREGLGDYIDFCQLPQDTIEPVHFIGSPGYLPLFLSLTDGLRANRDLQTKPVVYHMKAMPPKAPGCNLCQFRQVDMPAGKEADKRNWPYICAQDLLGRITKAT